MDSWEDDDFVIPEIVNNETTDKNEPELADDWEDEDFDLTLTEKKPVLAHGPTEEQKKQLEKKAREEDERLVARMEYSRQENETEEERKVRERLRVFELI